jgi:hypothetical protein
MKKTCIDCHFFKKDFEQRPWEINSLQREAISSGETDLSGDFSYGCYFMVWDAGYCCGLDVSELFKDIVAKERNDCFFWPYRPGMLFPAAKELQKREVETHEASRDRGLTTIGLWIAAIAIVVTALISGADKIAGCSSEDQKNTQTVINEGIMP